MTGWPDWLSDVSILRGAVPAELDGATATGVLWRAAPGRFLLDVPEVARYLVTDGQSIRVQPAPGAPEDEVERVLGLTPLAALLYQRGLLALHAAAALPPAADPGAPADGGAVLIAGDSGAGKSTLLAALVQRGWTPLAEELAILEVQAGGDPMVLPHPTPIRLWPDALEHLGLHTAPDASPMTAPAPLRALYWLDVHGQETIRSQTLTGTERFRALGVLSYHSHIADALLNRVDYLRQASHIAQAVPLRRLRRPRGRWCIPALVDQIRLVPND